MIRKILICSLLVGLTACSGTDPISVTAKPIEIDVARAADPSPVQMLPVHFRVVTADTVDAFLQEMRKLQGNTPVFVAITMKEYENLSLNLADLKRYISQQQAVIVYYRTMVNQASTAQTTPTPEPKKE